DHHRAGRRDQRLHGERWCGGGRQVDHAGRGAGDFLHRAGRHGIYLFPEPLMSGSAIEIRDLVTHYGPRLILDHVNLDVAHGEIMVIMGGSGSGKSTLLRHVLGLHTPSGGSIRLLGKDITSASADEMLALRRSMGVSFQGGALFSSMTVAENVMLPL